MSEKKVRYEWTKGTIPEFGMCVENLPEHWVYVSVYGHNADGKNVWEAWVVAGNRKRAETMRQDILDGLKAKGIVLTGASFHFWVNKYKPASRGAILNGHYSP